MSVIISFQWILTRKWAYLNGKISFSFRRWFSVFKAHGKDRQTVSSPSSKAMMLSAVSYNTDEWREVSGGWRDGSGGWKEGSIRWRDSGERSEKSNQQGEGYERKRADKKYMVDAEGMSTRSRKMNWWMEAWTGSKWNEEQKGNKE